MSECLATTSKKTQCTRKANDESQYCFQHQQSKEIKSQHQQSKEIKSQHQQSKEVKTITNVGDFKIHYPFLIMVDETDEQEEEEFSPKDLIMLIDNKDIFKLTHKELGRGDEGVVDEVISTTTGTKYALKTFHKETNDREMLERIDAFRFLKELECGPSVYFACIYKNIGYIVYDLFDVTLKNYLMLHPDKTQYYNKKLVLLLKSMEKLGKFDADFKFDNIMLNYDNPSKLYFADADIVNVEYFEDEDPNYINDVYDSLL